MARSDARLAKALSPKRPALTCETPFEVEFGDTAVRVQVYSDGMWTLLVGSEQIVLSGDQMRAVGQAFARLAAERGWA